jgi:ABC-type bacteriocin/lantibiotic exporter with double-glycine peptidase domain
MIHSGKKALLETIIVLMVLLAMEMAIPVGMNYMISSLETDKNIKTFLIAILFFLIAYVFLCFLNAINTKLYYRIGKQLLWNMREKIYQVLWKSSYFENVQKNKDKFKFVLENQTYTAFGIAVVYSLGGLTNALTILVFLGITFYYSFSVGIVIVVSIMITFLVSFITGKNILKGYETCNQVQEKDTSQIYETVDMVELTRTNGLMDYYLKKNQKVHAEFMDLSKNAEAKSSFCEAIENSLHSLIYIVVIGVFLITENISGSKLVTLLFVANMILDINQRLLRQLQVIIKNIPVFDNVVQLMEIKVENGLEIEKIASINAEHVSLELDGRTIIDDISFEIHTGDNVLMKGENGSGKSSLLKMILGMYKPTGGSLRINGKNISEYDTSTFFKEICYISQEEMMLNEKVEDYIRFITHSQKSNDYIMNLRNKVHLNEDIREIECNGATLSGGEKKKMLMLKCLVDEEVSVVILDEIDAGLDHETKCILKDMEKNLMSDNNKIFIKISHIDSDTDGFKKVIQL